MGKTEYADTIEFDVEVMVPVRVTIGIEDETWEVVSAKIKGKTDLCKLVTERCDADIGERVAEEIERIRADEDTGEDEEP